ncbi:hypothetical protein ST4_066 [Aeromonas phage ST4]|nr:hypothetical protein ST4_066 [Aeromonas phage ST4]
MEPSIGYYNRHEEEQAKGYERHDFLAGRVLQSAELNEIQSYANSRIKALGDALYKDGDIVRDARAIVNQDTGVTQLESGAVYLRGTVRGVPSGTITIPVTGTVVIGIYLNEAIVTEAEDPDLLDPARETRAYQEPGAVRLQVIPQWGYQGDGSSTGEFFPIYYVDDGQLRAKEAPPQLDSVSQAIARYDRDSAGTSYIVSGMQVTAMSDLEDGTQVYSVKDGRARINGFGVSLSTSRRLDYPATPDLRYIDSEPHASTTAGSQRIDLDRTPIGEITQVRITAEKTVALVHGTFAGAQDPLPDTSVIEIVSVAQGGTTYVKDVDYKLTAGKVDWSLPGNEPAPGSTYSATYRYIAAVEPTDVDDTGFTVSGAVSGTLILTNYYAKLPRIDRLCMDENGAFLWVKGVATDYDPVRPRVQSNLLAICQVTQTWDSNRRIVNDGVRVVPMNEIEGLNFRLDNLTDLVAQQKLVSDIGTREAAAKKGLFVDPFIDDMQRDQGIEQDAAVLGYALTLPIEGDAISVSTDVTGPTSCSFTLEPVLVQTSRTGDMKINPYMAFAVPPKPVTLTPAVDRWTETQTTWLSPITQKFLVDNAIKDAYHVRLYGNNLAGWPSYTTTTTQTVLVSSKSSRIEHLRQIDVRFEAAGFGPGEQLASLKFDGIPVTPVAI